MLNSLYISSSEAFSRISLDEASMEKQFLLYMAKAFQFCVMAFGLANRSEIILDLSCYYIRAGTIIQYTSESKGSSR